MQKNDGLHLGLGLCPRCHGNNQVCAYHPVQEEAIQFGFKDSYEVYCAHCEFGSGHHDTAEEAEDFWKKYFGRQQLREGREHLTEDGQFQSDKYDWCQPGYLPLSLKDPMARDLIAEYAKRRAFVDKEFGRDITEALDNTEVEEKLYFAIVAPAIGPVFPGSKEAMGVCGVGSMVDVLETDPDARFFPITKEQFDAWGDDQSVVQIPEDF